MYTFDHAQRYKRQRGSHGVLLSLASSSIRAAQSARKKNQKNSKKEKKFLMRAHIYLDALLSLYRMPA
jgi:hypothetical protein